MRLTHITLPATDVAGVATFYGDVLGLPVSNSDDATLVRVGPSTLEFRATASVVSAHHLAFTIPMNKLPAGKAWLQDRAPLLTRADQDEFEGPAGWNSRSVYFAGPEQSVLELIVRRDLDNARPGPFTSPDLLCLSEVGIGVADVRAVAGRLEAEAGVRPYGNEPGEEFAAVGDVGGLLILVSPGRPWVPTTDRLVTAVPTSVIAEGVARTGHYPLGAGSSLELRDH